MENTILIIEDDEAIREILAYSLIEEGFDIIQAATGEEGFQIVEEKHVDLIILDLMLPDINGFDICKRISVIYNVIFFSLGLTLSKVFLLFHCILRIRNNISTSYVEKKVIDVNMF